MLVAFVLGILAVSLGGLSCVLSPFLGVWCFIPGILAAILGTLAIIFGHKHKEEKRGFNGLLMGAIGGGVGFGLFVVWVMLAIMGM